MAIIKPAPQWCEGYLMAIKERRIRCAACGRRMTIIRGERGPVSTDCDLCRSRLIDGAAETLLLDTLLAWCRDHKLLMRS